MTENEKMSLVIQLAEKALEKNELPIACIIFYNDTIIAQSHTSESEDKRLLVHAELKALMELDQKRMKPREKMQMELYSLAAPSDGAAEWAERSWDAHHTKSSFCLPAMTSGILEAESKELFKRYIDIHKEGPLVEWVKTIIC